MRINSEGRVHSDIQVEGKIGKQIYFKFKILAAEKKHAVLVNPNNKITNPLAMSPAGSSHSTVVHCGGTEGSASIEKF